MFENFSKVFFFLMIFKTKNLSIFCFIFFHSQNHFPERDLLMYLKTWDGDRGFQEKMIEPKIQETMTNKSIIFLFLSKNQYFLTQTVLSNFYSSDFPSSNNFKKFFGSNFTASHLSKREKSIGKFQKRLS